MSAARERATCRHCGKPKVNRPRGLCWTCYYAPGVARLYPPASKYGRRGAPDRDGATAPAPEPTPAPAGSLEKLKALRARARAGTDLHHPADAREIHHRGPIFRDRYDGGDTGLEE